MKEVKDKKMEKKKEDSAGYAGKVEIGVVRKGKRYKRFTTNAGTLNLFTFLCNCLSARLNPNAQVDIAERPGTLAIVDSIGNKILSYNIPVSDLTVEPIESTNNPRCSVIFYFLIPGTSILGKSIQRLQLRGVKGESVFAEAAFNDSITINDIDTNIYVTWTLTIMNK